jgi:DNA protecting protein DprA
MNSHAMARRASPAKRFSSLTREPSYVAPRETASIGLTEALQRYGRGALDERQLDMLRNGPTSKVMIYYAGDLGALECPAISIVGTREVSEPGRERAVRLAQELASAGILIVSGLARGVDTAALKSAISSCGNVAAVIGTPLSKAYPAENARLQEEIYGRHLLISPFAEGAAVFKGNFPARNRVMAALTDATVIVEASDTSGTLHQAAECQRLGRWLFILKEVVDDKALQWPSRFVGKPFVEVVSHTSEIIDRLQ